MQGRTLPITLILIALSAVAQDEKIDYDPKLRITREEITTLPDPAVGAVLRGRVTSESGEPVEGATVWGSINHWYIRFDASVSTRTDATGAYEIRLPWSGVAYRIYVSDDEFYSDQQHSVIEPEQTLNLVLRPRPEIKEGPEEHFVRGVVRRQDGSPVPGAEVVHQSTEKHERRGVADESGAFVLSLRSPFYSSHVYAQFDGMVSPLSGVFGNQDHTIELVLGASGSLGGTVATSDDGKPAAGCIVGIAAMLKQPVFVLEATTDASGQYHIGDLPPGTYRFVTHFPYPGADNGRFLMLDRKDVVVSAGARTRLDLEVEKPVRLKGRVVGPSGEPAGLAMIKLSNSPEVEFPTDEEGRFSVSLPPRDRDTFRAFSPRYGFGMLEFPDVKSGEYQSGMEIKLNGVARLHGLLRGVNLESVSGVRLLDTVTDHGGRFDTGPIPIPPDPAGFKIEMILPRPDSGDYPYFVDPAEVAKDDARERYYHPSNMSVAAKHGEDIDISIKLSEAHLRLVRGTVRDAQGNPVPKAHVHLYAGMPTTDQWLEDVAPRYPWIGQKGQKGPRPATLVARTETDESGAWSMRMIAESPEAASKFYNEYQVNSLVLFATDAQYRTVGMAAGHVVHEHQEEFEFPIELRPAPADVVLRARVVDRNAKPIPDTEWVVDSEHGPYRSDREGYVPIPRLHDRPGLRLLNPGYCVISAHVGERDPQHAPEKTAAIPYFGDQGATLGFGSTQDPKPPIEFGPQFVVFDFVDDENACIVITLDHCEEKKDTSP